MWDELLEEIDLDGHDGPDLPACFFVGDAGGRPARKDAKADHASSDRFNYRGGSCILDVLKIHRDFATNVGITYKSPEEIFLHEAPHSFVRTFEPNEYIDNSPASADASMLHAFQPADQP